MGLKQDFKNPPNQYRPIPFWSWNDELDLEEIAYQIKELKKGGNGGFFMHARSGLKTSYLSPEWFQAIKTGIDVAKEEGMHAWIYDEEGWPSGFAGGLVPDQSSDFHAKFITIKKIDKIKDVEKDKLITCYSYHKSSNEIMKVDVEKQLEVQEEETIYAVYKHTNPYYIDTLNKRAIEAFLQCTHEAYYERFEEFFGNVMHGFFTDEPRLTCNNFGDIAWSDELPDTFFKRYGYDVTNYLPMLFYEIGDYEKIRYDFWETVSTMFAENYMKTIYDWCEKHKCKVTGHIMMEESIFSQMTSTAGVMPFYEYMHVPGIDWLRRRIDSPVIGKQVGSVACQLGKKQILTESYALCGWNVSFEELKWIAEWQFVNGVNQICQHLMAYTIKGVRKRDYPPSHFTQQTWWKHANRFNDYLGRLCVALSEGDQTADVLLLHPMRSGYLAFDGTRTKEMKTLDEEFIKASECLSGSHISYHYGDETIIKKYGSVTNGLFQVGCIGYKTVILPFMYAIDGSTLKLLLEFSKQGGTILSLGALPHFTNGDYSLLKELVTCVQAVEFEKVRKVLEKQNLITLSILEEGKEVDSITYLQRKTKEGELFFLVNHNQEKRFQTKVQILGKVGTILHMIPESGEMKPLKVKEVNHNTVFSLTFEPMQSYLLAFYPNQDIETDVTDEEEIRIQKVYPDSRWVVKDISLNSYTLDQCQYRLDGGEWQAKIPTIQLQNHLLEMKRAVNVEMKYDFQINMDLDENKEFYVVIEDAKLYDITVNGFALKHKEIAISWWKDKSFHKVDIKSYLQNGYNEIILKINFKQPQKVYDVLFGENVYETEKNKITYDIELESIYLLGDFGVVSKTPYQKLDKRAFKTAGPFEIVAEPKVFASNEFTTQGLLFFAGEVSVTQTLFIHKEEGKRMILDFGKQNAPMMNLHVNGVLVKHSLWAPYEVDITDVALEGENEILITLYASNRNLLGPHHHINGECYNVGPESFTGKWSWVERESESDATDIADRTKSYWDADYCFVEFGPSPLV